MDQLQKNKHLSDMHVDTVKPVLWGHSKEDKNGFQDRLSLNTGQKYCRMLQEGAFCNTFNLH